MRPTSRDVAELAQVSRATVSYVLNRTPGQKIPEETRQRVLAAAKQLRYTPHASARTLRSGSSRLILVVMPQMAFGANAAVVLTGLTQGLTDLGMSVATWQRTGPVDLATTLGNLQPRLVVGVFGLTEEERQLLEALSLDYIDSTNTDEDLGGAAVLQVKHLAQRGHRRLACVTSSHPLVAMFAGPRERAVLRTCRELGLPSPEVIRLGAPDDEALDILATRFSAWVRNADAPTAVAAYNDIFATACLAAAARVGLNVPDDLAIMGVDDLPTSRFLQPGLTTVSLDLDAVAASTIERTRAVVEGRPANLGDGGTAYNTVVVRESA